MRLMRNKTKSDTDENEFKQFASDKIKNIESRLEEIEKESTTENISNPQAELINRQNLKARLSFTITQKSLSMSEMLTLKR